MSKYRHLDEEPEGATSGEMAQRLIRQVMTDKKWRATQMGGALGRHPDLIRRWLRGERKVSVYDLMNVARLGGYSLDEWFGLTPTQGEGVRVGYPAHADDRNVRQIVQQTVADILTPVATCMVTAIELARRGEIKSSFPGTGGGQVPAQAKHVLSDRARRALESIAGGELPTERRGFKNELIDFPTNSVVQFWQEWADGPRDVASFRLQVKAITHAARLAARKDDWDGFFGLLRLLEAGLQWGAEEPFRSFYDSGWLTFTELTAQQNIEHNRVPEAISDLLQMLDTIQAIQQRRLELGLQELKFSEMKLLTLGLLAICLCEQPPTTDTKAATAEIIDVFWTSAELLIPSASKLHGAASEEFRDYLAMVCDNAIEVTKLSVAMAPGTTTRCVAKFNKLGGPHLTTEPGHFRKQDTSGCSAWYWDFELAKLRAAGSFEETEEQLCERNRLAAARLTIGAAYQSSEPLWRREREQASLRQRRTAQSAFTDRRRASFPA